MNAKLASSTQKTSNVSALEVWQQLTTQEFPEVIRNLDYKGSAYIFGFVAFSQLLLNFTCWLHTISKQRGVKELYFLSRDGKILFDYFNQLYPKGDIKTHYIFCSRRALKSISIDCEEDIVKFFDNFRDLSHFNISSLLDYLCNLEMTAQISENFLEYGFKDFHQPLLLNSDQRQRLIQAFLQIKVLIINSSKSYRNNYINYLKNNGLTNLSTNVAVVDIGYECSAQATFAKLLQKNDLHGFYLGTFQEALFKLRSLNYADSYLFNFASRGDDPYHFVSNVELIETLVCDYHDSFIRIDKQNGKLRPVFFSDSSIEQTSKNTIKEIHSGALEFANLLAISNVKSSLARLKPAPPEAAFQLLEKFIGQPSHKNDVKIFEGIKFSYDSITNLSHYLIAPRHSLGQIPRPISLWVEGEKILNRSNHPTVAKIQGASLNIEQQILQRVLNGKFKRKYCNNRWLFFADSKSKSFKLYFNYLGQYF